MGGAGETPGPPAGAGLQAASLLFAGFYVLHFDIPKREVTSGREDRGSLPHPRGKAAGGTPTETGCSQLWVCRGGWGRGSAPRPCHLVSFPIPGPGPITAASLCQPHSMAPRSHPLLTLYFPTQVGSDLPSCRPSTISLTRPAGVGKRPGIHFQVCLEGFSFLGQPTATALRAGRRCQGR